MERNAPVPRFFAWATGRKRQVQISQQPAE
jgi:hypothetical protein